MGADSKIQWTKHTFDPWRGCTKVSEGCRFCYADTLSLRNPKVMGMWGPSGSRVVASESMWKQPEKWNRAAAEAGERHRVFCASLADVFEGSETMPAASVEPVRLARRRLFKLIQATPNLDWLLLTKRPQNVIPLTRQAIDPFDDPELDYNAAAEPNGLDVATFGELYPNVWLGTSVENQATADDRLLHLAEVPAAVKFISAEPLLGPVNLMGWDGRVQRNWLDPKHPRGVHWVIAGCESGAHRRPMAVEWVESLRDQCATADVAFFLKQMEVDGRVSGELDEFPAGLQIRQFPEV